VKTIALAFAAVATLMTAQAGAAPLSARSAEPAFSWTGCYVGLVAGAGWQTSSYTTQQLESASGVGPLGGGEAGCNYEWDMFVFGLEGELWGSGLYDREYQGEGANDFEDLKSRNIWDAAISARMGLAVLSRALIYGKLGAIAGNLKYSEFDNSGSSSFTQNGSATYIGVLMGLGLEYALTDNWTAKIEYNHIDYGNKIVGLNGTSCGFGLCMSFTTNTALKETKEIMKLGVNYKF
jgi:outer membrane immunogenic protein